MKSPKTFDSARALSRRTVLRGAGVALTLPWLESLQPREARAQAVKARLRFLPIYLPSGAPPRWRPPATGSGDAWALSSVLEPLSALKRSVTVLSGMENGSAFNADGSASVEPSHGRQSGAWLTCVDAREVSTQLGAQDANGISADQVIAQSAAFQGATQLESLQVGLSTTESFCDGSPCSHSRNVSWKTPILPLYKSVDPQEVFDHLLGAGAGQATEEAIKRRAARKSVLDAVKDSAGVVRPKLNAHDQQRMDAFLESVRSIEQRIDAGPTVVRNCDVPPGQFLRVTGMHRQNSETYNKGAHADAMNDLIALAFQCDLTRVISYMLEDERSEFTCDHIPRRKFGDLTSTLDAGVCGEWHGAQLGERDQYASIVHWNVGKVAELCQRLANLDDGDGRSVLDNSVVFMGACMNHDFRCANLPALLVGGGGGALKGDQHLDLVNRPMRDLYFTLMNSVLGLNETTFGVNRTGAPLKPISELLA